MSLLRDAQGCPIDEIGDGWVIVQEGRESGGPSAFNSDYATYSGPSKLFKEGWTLGGLEVCNNKLLNGFSIHTDWNDVLKSTKGALKVALAFIEKRDGRITEKDVVEIINDAIKQAKETK